jgi:hypothetical protein
MIYRGLTCQFDEGAAIRTLHGAAWLV